MSLPLWADKFDSQETLRKQVNWKLLFGKLFARNIGKIMGTPGSAQHLEALRKSIYFSYNDVNQDYRTIVSAPNTNAAFEKREEIFGNKRVREGLLGGDLCDETSPDFDWEGTKAAQLISLLDSNKDSKAEGNYFKSLLGKIVVGNLSDTVMIVIPGFGSHTITDYTWPEIVEEANEYYGRPVKEPGDGFDYSVPHTRPRKVVGRETVWQPYRKFYGNHNKDVGFDVLHPLGSELGNSMGTDRETASYLRAWILGLPKAYKDKKLILVGYSKGAPIALSLVESFPDMRKRISYIVTLAGAVQGAVPAQSGLNSLIKVVGDDSIEAALRFAQSDGRKFLENLMPAMGFAANFWQRPELKSTLKIWGIDVDAMLQGASGYLETQKLRRTLLGIQALTQSYRAKWNLTRLNSAALNRPLTIFNLSSITNVKDFFLPDPVIELGPAPSPLTIPQMNEAGRINWPRFSLDNVFLHLTSVGGFEESPGGLFDTQVALMDTKSLPLDFRPLSETFSRSDLNKLWAEPAIRTILEVRGFTRSTFASAPRNTLVPDDELQGLNFVNLGEIRGTHWNITFRQVYKPLRGETPYYQHTFPRKAYAVSLIETLALYRLTTPRGGE